MASLTQPTASIAFSENSPPSAPPSPDPAERTSSFGDQLKELRRRYCAKQLVLSEMLGCTGAAISLWESGARFPKEPMFVLLLNALAKEGVSPHELRSLRQRWLDERPRRFLRPTLPLPGERSQLS
jgi:transcriptional regulator with XRE-family HTH domain